MIMGIWLLLKGAFNFLMKVSVPLLVAGLVLLTVSGSLIWKWGVADRGRKKAEAHAVMLHDALQASRRDLAACEASVDRLTISLEAQNAAVDALRAESDERMRRASAAITKARQQARALQGRIARLEAAKPSGGDLCVAARSLIVNTLQEERQ